MAVDISKFIDNSLKAEFEKKPYDVSKDRAKLVKRFEAALGQFQTGKTKVPNRWWTASNGVVEFKVVLDGVDLPINKATTNYVPEGQFEGFIKALVALTNEGAFDAALSSPAKPSAARSKGSSTRTLSDTSRLNIRVGGFRRGGMDDASIKAKLKAEGVSDEAIKAALSYKRAK